MRPEEAGPGASGRHDPFSSAPFTRWWIASLVAGTGVGIQTVTVPLFLRDRVEADERALAIAAALIVQTLPGALLTLPGGAVADRIERRRILVRSYGVAALVSALYVYLAGWNVRSIWPVFPLAAIVGAAGAFTNPARQSMLPQLVTRDQLQNGVIFGTMGFMATLQFLGPTVGGLVTEQNGLTVAFALEAALLMLAAVVFSTIRTVRPAATGRTVVADLKDGIRFVRRRPTLRMLVLMAALPGIFFIGPFSVTIPIVVPDVLGAGDKWVGLLWGCFGAGVFTCSLLLTVRPVRRRGFAVCASLVAAGLILTLYGTSETLWLSAVLLVIWGGSAAVFINYVIALLQENTEPHMMGRVMSMYSFAFFAASPIGYLQAGLLTDVWGPQLAVIASGIAAALLGVVCLATLRGVRDLR